MTNVPQAGSGGTPQADPGRTPQAGPGRTPQGGSGGTPGLADFLKKMTKNPTLRRVIPFDTKGFEKNLREDIKRIFAVREQVQINRLERATLEQVQKKLSAVKRNDVPDVMRELNSLSGRVSIVCNAATYGLLPLLKPNGSGLVRDLEQDGLRQIGAGLDLGLPDSENKMQIQAKILETAGDNGRRSPGKAPREYLWAAGNALRSEIRARLVSDAIMAVFAGLGSEEEVVPAVLERLRRRLEKAGRTENQMPREAGTMSEYAISELEKALEDPKFKEAVEKRVEKVRNGARAGAVAPKRGRGRNERAEPPEKVAPRLNTEVMVQLKEKLGKPDDAA